MEKEYSIRTEQKEKYFYFYVEGLDCYASSLGYWLEIIDVIIRNGYRKVLVEENLTGSLTTLETYKLSMKIAESAGKLKAKIAFFDRNPSHLSNNSFGETVVTTRGLKIKVFPSLETAENWLINKVGTN